MHCGWVSRWMKKPFLHFPEPCLPEQRPLTQPLSVVHCSNVRPWEVETPSLKAAWRGGGSPGRAPLQGSTVSPSDICVLIWTG